MYLFARNKLKKKFIGHVIFVICKVMYLFLVMYGKVFVQDTLILFRWCSTFCQK